MQKVINELNATMEFLETGLKVDSNNIVRGLIESNLSLSETMKELYIKNHIFAMECIEFYNKYMKKLRAEVFNDEEEKAFQEALYSRIRLILNDKGAEYLINEMKKLA